MKAVVLHIVEKPGTREYLAAVPLPHMGSAFDKQPYRGYAGKSGCGNVPAGGACRIPFDFQRDLVPAVREQGSVTTSGVDAAAVQQEPGMRIVIVR